MKCPKCDHVSETALLQCGSCGEVYDRHALEELQHLDYLLNWLKTQQELLGPISTRRLTQEVHSKRDILLAKLLPEPAPLPEPAAPVLTEVDLEKLAILVAVREQAAGWLGADLLAASSTDAVLADLNAKIDALTAGFSRERPDLPPVPAEAAAKRAFSLLEEWRESGILPIQEHSRLHAFLTGGAQAVPLADEPARPEAAPAAEPTMGRPAALTAAVKPVAAPKPMRVPAPPPPPREPLIRWDRLWASVVEAAVSGLLLRWLRYVGALLFVVSLGIVVVNFWSDIPQWGQVLIIFFIPAAFYGGGWFLRRRLGVVQTGGVLMGVGQVLLAVDFAAIYQFGGLTIPINAYWLASSVICTLVYLLTVLFLVRDEFFGYIGLAGIASTAMAGVALGSRSVQWPLASLAAFGVLCVEAGYRLGRGSEKWREIGEAARRFPQVTVPMALLALLLIPGDLARPAQAAAFVLAAVTAGMLAWRFSTWVHTHVAVWASALAAVFILRAFQVPWTWYPLAGTVLSFIYISLFRLASDRAPAGIPGRRLHVLAFGAGGAAALLLSGAAGVVAVAFDYWPGVIALAAVSTVIASASVLLRRPVLALGAGALAVAPASLAAWAWLAPLPQRVDWLMAVWGGLALSYLLLALGLRRWPAYADWISLLAHGLTPVPLAAVAGYSFFRSGFSSLPILGTLGAAIAVYGVSSLVSRGAGHPALSGWSGETFGRYRSSVFLYPLAALVPFFAAVAWAGSILVPAWLGVLLGVLMLSYIGAGQRLGRIDPAYRLPFAGTSYLIGAWAVLASLGARLPSAISLYLVVAGLAGLAWVYRRPIETGAAAVLLLWPIGLTMDLLRILPHAFTVGFTLLAGLLHIPLGIRLRSRVPEQQHHLPLFAVGYAVSALALILSLAGRSAGFAVEAPWIGLVVPLMGCALYVFSSYAVHPWFAWAAAIALPLGFWRGLSLLRIFPEWHAPAWAGLAIGYLALRGVLKRAVPEPAQRFRLPLGLGAWLLAGLGLALTAPGTLSALRYGTNVMPAPALAGAIAGQALAAGFVILAAIIYRSNLPLFLEPWLAALPSTLAFIAFGERAFGAPLTAPQFGIVWAGLGVVHLAAALGLDQRARVRESLQGQVYGLHLGGYLLPVIGTFWSLDEQVPLLWSLGLLIAVCAASAYLVHQRRHPAWEAVSGRLSRWLAVEPDSHLRDAFIWLTAWLLPVWAVLFLDLLPLVSGFAWLSLPAVSLLYLGAAQVLGRVNDRYRLPFHLAGQASAAVGLLVSAPFTARVLAGRYDLTADTLPGLAFVLLQSLAAAYYGLFAWLHRRGVLGYLFAYPAALLSFFPFTLGWVLYAQLPVMDQYALPWMGLAVFWIFTAAMLDRQRDKPGRAWSLFRAHGPYLAGYGLASYAVFWSLPFRREASWSFVIALGIWVTTMVASAAYVQAGRHRTWDELVESWLAAAPEIVRRAGRGIFAWLAAWTFPVWVTMLLWQLDVRVSYGYLGYAGSALVFLVAAVPLRRVERTFGWALLSAGQFYTLLALLPGVADTRSLLSWRGVIGVKSSEEVTVLSYVVTQSLGALYYAASSAYFSHRRWIARLFAYLSALFVWTPFSLAWIVFRFGEPDFALAYPLLGLAGSLLAAGFVLDWYERQRAGAPRVGFAHGPYLSGYLGLVYVLLWSRPERLTYLYVFAACLVLALASHAVVHYRRHDTWADFSRMFAGAGHVVQTVVRTGFLWTAALGAPIWLAYVLAYHAVPLPWRGLALALAAPLYIAFGLAVRRTDAGSAWPLYAAGYLLTAVGAMLTFEDQVLAIYVLALDAVVYAVSAYIFRQSAWLYLTAILIPVIGLLAIEYRLDALPAEWIAGSFMGLAVVYLAVGRLFDRGRETGAGVSPFGLPFYASGYLLSAVALAAAAERRELAIVVFLAGVAVYAWSAWAFREPVFLYPAAWLAAVPYYLGLTYTRLDPAWYGVGWLPLIGAALAAGRLVFHKKPLTRDPAHPALPFYLLAYALSLSMILVARGNAPAMTAAFAAAAVLYLLSARLFQKPAWLYPGLLALHAAVLVAFSLEPLDLPAAYQPVFLLPVTFAMGLLAGRLRQAPPTGEFGETGAWNPGWALPYATFAVVDIALGQMYSLGSWESGIVAAAGHAVLLGLLAWNRSNRRFVWGSIGFVLLALGLRLAWAGPGWPRFGALAAGIGFGLYLTAWAADALAARLPEHQAGAWRRERVAMWVAPLEAAGIAVVGLGVGAALVFFAFGAEIAIALAFAGALLLGVSYRRQRFEPGYLGVALMEAALVLVLLGEEVRQPQWYAIPVGLYFVGLGFFERRRGRVGFAALLEGFGLAAMLLTSFVQSLDLETDFWYFLLMLGETVLVIVWSAQQRRKAPFLIGAGGMLANVVGQVAIIFFGGTTLVRWLIFGGLGLLILLAAIYAERWVIPRAQEVRERLEGWS